MGASNFLTKKLRAIYPRNLQKKLPPNPRSMGRHKQCVHNAAHHNSCNCLEQAWHIWTHGFPLPKFNSEVTPQKWWFTLSRWGSLRHKRMRIKPNHLRNYWGKVSLALKLILEVPFNQETSTKKTEHVRVLDFRTLKECHVLLRRSWRELWVHMVSSY